MTWTYSARLSPTEVCGWLIPIFPIWKTPALGAPEPFPPAVCAQVLEAPVAYATGAPNGVALGDMNGDGELDVVVANADQSGTISVLLGSGDGSLQPAVTYPAGSYPQFVVWPISIKAGHLDAVAIRAIGGLGFVKICWAMAMERCGAPVPYGPFHVAFSLAVANFNHDGTVDIVVADVSSGGLLLAKGDGTFRVGNPSASDAVFYTVADFQPGSQSRHGVCVQYGQSHPNSDPKRSWEVHAVLELRSSDAADSVDCSRS